MKRPRYSQMVIDDQPPPRRRRSKKDWRQLSLLFDVRRPAPKKAPETPQSEPEQGEEGEGS